MPLAITDRVANHGFILAAPTRSARLGDLDDDENVDLVSTRGERGLKDRHLADAGHDLGCLTGRGPGGFAAHLFSPAA